MKPLPSRSKISDKIHALLDGGLSCQEISAWAMGVVLDESYILSDQVSWRVLMALGGIDTPNANQGYLYDSSDFQGWLESLQ